MRYRHGMIAAVLAVLLAAGAVPPGSGVPESLARERASAIRDLQYDLDLQVPAARMSPIGGRVVVRLTLVSAGRLVLDFSRPREAVRALRLDGRDAAFDAVNGHLVLPSVSAGAHEV